MKEHSDKNNMVVEYFSIKTRDSKENPFAIDMVLNWQSKQLAGL